MARNTPKGTPAKIFITFVIIAGIVTCFALRDLVDRKNIEGVVYPTGVGDRAFYRGNFGGGDDFSSANLKFESDGKSLALYRLNSNPVSKPDDKMYRVADGPGGVHVYIDSRRESAEGEVPRFYLKANDGKYIEFAAEQGLKRPGANG